MRMLGLLFATLLVLCLNLTQVCAQGAEERRAEDQSEPYRKHHDTRHGHDHVYPDRGAIVRDLPRGAIIINYAGLSYRYHDGLWFEPRGPAFMVVEPPIGVTVPTLPSFATPVPRGGEEYLYVNGTYYRPRPELGGYEVVNEPAEVTPASRSAGVAGAASGAGVGAASGVAIGATQSSGSATPSPEPQAAAAAITTPPGAAGSAAPNPPAAPMATAATAAPTATAASTPPPTVSPSVRIPTPGATPLGATPAPTTPAPTTLSAGSSGPPVSGTPPSASPTAPKVFLYPKSGQGPDQQARDRYECYRFAVAQTGFDPMHSSGGPHAEQQSDYERAQAACFDGRGYTVR